jgi:hypothetical protein
MNSTVHRSAVQQQLHWPIVVTGPCSDGRPCFWQSKANGFLGSRLSLANYYNNRAKWKIVKSPHSLATFVLACNLLFFLPYREPTVIHATAIYTALTWPKLNYLWALLEQRTADIMGLLSAQDAAIYGLKPHVTRSPTIALSPRETS